MEQFQFSKNSHSKKGNKNARIYIQAGAVVRSPGRK